MVERIFLECHPRKRFFIYVYCIIIMVEFCVVKTCSGDVGTIDERVDSLCCVY